MKEVVVLMAKDGTLLPVTLLGADLSVMTFNCPASAGLFASFAGLLFPFHVIRQDVHSRCVCRLHKRLAGNFRVHIELHGVHRGRQRMVEQGGIVFEMRPLFAEKKCSEIFDAVCLAVFLHSVDLDVKRTNRGWDLNIAHDAVPLDISTSRQIHMGRDSNASSRSLRNQGNCKVDCQLIDPKDRPEKQRSVSELSASRRADTRGKAIIRVKRGREERQPQERQR